MTLAPEYITFDEKLIVLAKTLNNHKTPISKSDSHLIENYGGKTIYDILIGLSLIKIEESEHVTVYTCKIIKQKYN